MNLQLKILPRISFAVLEGALKRSERLSLFDLLLNFNLESFNFHTMIMASVRRNHKQRFWNSDFFPLVVPPAGL
jgi:hypothetical protein